MSLNENKYRRTCGNLRLGRVCKTKQGQRSLNQESPGFSRGECQWYDERVQVEPDEPLFIPDEDDFTLGAGLLAED